MAPVLETLAALVRINSVNPSYEGGQPESAIAAWISDFYRARGIPAFEQEVFPGRPNLIARLEGQDPSRRIVMEAHMDTASVAGMSIPPFDPTVSGGRMYGRGTCDTKAGLAAMMHALVRLKQEGIMPPREVWVVAAADEEFSYRGVVRLCEGLQADAGVVSEPTDMRAVIATKGCVRWRILTRGRAAHSSKPHLGVNAIEHMARVVTRLAEDSLGLAKRSHPLVGPPTLNVGLIHGGVQVNFVPDACVIELDRRLIPGEEVISVLASYQVVLDQLKAEHPEIDVVMEAPMIEDIPLETPAASRVVEVASSVLKDLGRNAAPEGVPYGSDASKLSRAGIPSIVIGPGSIDQAHAAVEFVECGQVELAEEFYYRFMLSFH